MRPLGWLTLLAACASAPSEAPPPVADTPAVADPPAVASIDIEDPAACAGCHNTVVEEWNTSQHSRAHQSQDPVYAGMRTLRMAKEGEALGSKCDNCHAPQQATAQAATRGITCATCHHLDGVEAGKKGAKALSRPEEGILRGPHDLAAGAPAPHGVGPAAPWLTDGKTVCLACHGDMSNPAGAVTCNTGPEHVTGGSEQGCTDCHMPEVDTASGAVSARSSHRSHAFLGPHTGWPQEPSFLKSGVNAALSLEGQSLSLSLTNTAAHSVPTGFPGRMVLITAEGLDGAGAVVWKSHQGDPMAQDPQSVLNKVYVDADGAPILPPYGVSIARDTRLKPGEIRELTWEVPTAVVAARAVLAYRLVPPPAVPALKLDGHPDAATRPFLKVQTP